jgi:hypothetical protein
MAAWCKCRCAPHIQISDEPSFMLGREQEQGSGLKPAPLLLFS